MSISTDQARSSSARDIVVFAIAPAIVGVAILISWALSYFNIGPSIFSIVFALFATVFGGYQRFISGFKDIFKRKITVNVFVTVALLSTIAIGEFLTASILIFIMSVAGAFESYTLDKTRKSIRSLLDITPKMVTIKQDQEETIVSINDVREGDIVIVRPGERIAVDGLVVNGKSTVNQAPITGESIPVEKYKGSEVYSGTLNEEGRIEIKTSRVGEDTTLAKIIHLTEEAQATRPPIQNLADKFTQWFLPAVVLIATFSYLYTRDIKTAVSVLLVACPCAFAIATPTAVTAGISNMARRGILVKGGIYLEEAGKMNALLVDKTGTFTLGSPKVMDIISFKGTSQQDVLYWAAIGEKYSEHPLAKAILNYARVKGISIPDPDEFKIKIGKGVIASYEQSDLVIGKSELLIEESIYIDDAIKSHINEQSEKGRTIMLVAKDKVIVGLISMADEIRPGTRNAITLLKNMGIKNIIMLTGDNPIIAKAVAEEIGVDDYRANMLPEEKQNVVKELQDQKQKVAMVGDGINDAPALALADIGIAMGGSGTDVAVETASVSLMRDDIFSIVDFVMTSKKVFQRIKLNIFFSIIYNVIGLALASMGLLTPVWAIIFQEAGCLTVVVSSTLLLWYQPNLPASNNYEAGYNAMEEENSPA